ncbi:MAG: hypothetical protein IPM13_01410 [Phycisphaerales bacterium]|nr:hypothetical protein [Phycisphaerales bacterium]
MRYGCYGSLIGALTGIALLVGCATPPAGESIRTSAPTPDEYPRVSVREDALIQASVVAERDRHEPRTRIVGEFKEPELTPEEKQALGKVDPPYRLLAHLYPLRRPNSTISSEEGLQVGVGPAGRGIAVSRDTTGIAAVGLDADSVDLGTDPFITRVLALLRPYRAAYPGPDESLSDIGIGDRRSVAKARRYRED